MSNEITISGLLSFAKGSLADSLSLTGLLATMAGADYIKSTQLVTTSEAALNIPAAIGTPGYIFMVNRDATNFIKVRAASGAADLIKIHPGKFALFELAAASPYVIADTASCQIEYLLIEA